MDICFSSKCFIVSSLALPFLTIFFFFSRMIPTNVLCTAKLCNTLISNNGTGQDCLWRWPGLVKSMFRRVGRDWSRMSAVVSRIGQDCPWGWLGLVKNVCGSRQYLK